MGRSGPQAVRRAPDGAQGSLIPPPPASRNLLLGRDSQPPRQGIGLALQREGGSMTAATSLSPPQLRRRCDPAGLSFRTTAELPDLPEICGQDRAIDAIRFGIGIRRYGYNLFALGPPGMGKHGFVRQFLERKAATEPTPPDWCYVHNFSDPYKPRALRLPAGRGVELRKDIDRLIEELRVAIPAALESEDYQTRKQLLENRLSEESEQPFAEIEKHAQKEGVAVIRTPVGVAMAPTRKGEVMDPEAFGSLPKEKRERFTAEMNRLQDKLKEALGALPGKVRKHRTELKALSREAVGFAVGHLIDELRARYADIPEVLDHLKALEQDVLDNSDEFLAGSGQQDALTTLLSRRPAEPRARRRYEVNVLVDHSATTGAPVVYEDHPSHGNLVGRVEHQAELGSFLTDFRLIRPGAFHRANGGYLIIDVRKVLQQPFAWEGVKRVLRARQVKIESPGQALSLFHTASMDPEPIPLDLKVVLVGERIFYYVLAQLDADFLELSKVAADFEETLDRTPENEGLYARLVSGLARKEGLRALDAGATARVVEHGARMAGDAEKLSVQTEGLADVLREADHYAGQAGQELVGEVHVQKAIDEQIRRAARVRDRIQEEIRRGTLLIDTQGEKVGQVNGLSVLQLGGFSFGKPSRITARVRLGSGRVLDIEREVELGGPIHSKGVLILAGFLGSRYCPERPLSLQASLVFEQSYSGVEGDSASCAELCALLSALADAPIKQSLAVTGSVNQQGEVQAVGGVNDKIEGFFDLCRARGLTGTQGVLIPASNVKHLMLREDVVAAVAQGVFHVHAIHTVNEAIELLTGLPAGERNERGEFGEGSLNARVEARLVALAESARAFLQTQKTESA
jgi:lon-related putative ATP-dependent protease